MIAVDVVGLRCPIPVQRLRIAIRENPGQGIKLIGDDPESLHDIPALLERMGLPPAIISETEGGWEFAISTG